MEFRSRFFHNRDFPVDGPRREIVGYGEHPPKVRWENDAKVAVQLVVNYEEGSEKTFAMGDGENDILYELPFKLDDQRDLAVETMYEYGTRAGIWRLFRVFDAAGIPVTFFATAVAL
jgi:peptidoglycan/xylan/chitin deacetylase (PgdA/CDA1 family)